GPKGDNGEKGDPGVDGTNGADGQDGADGKDGLNGVDGQDGTDGKNGLNGADGQDGVDGMDGLNGATGADGADGKDATVVASSWIVLTENDFVSSQKPRGWGEMFDATHTTPLLTQEALDQDVILVYLKLNSGQIVLMPYVHISDEMSSVAY